MCCIADYDGQNESISSYNQVSLMSVEIISEGPVNRNSRGLLASLLGLLIVSPVTAQTTSPAPPRLGGYFQARETAQERAGLSAVPNRARFSIDRTLPAQF